ncbi:MAG: hypothetical protein SGCHY_001079 [Lobulomycetales sp.]
MLMRIAPIYASNIKEGIRDFFEPLLMRYLPEADGVLVTFRNVRLEGKTAALVNESPFLQFYIIVDLVLFSPSIDAALKGRVSKICREHVGLLIHGSFNASISSDELANMYTWDDGSESWRSKADSGVSISTGSSLEFLVKRFVPNFQLTPLELEEGTKSYR